MINNQNTKNTLAGAAGVIAGELIYNAVMPNSVNAGEPSAPQETTTTPEPITSQEENTSEVEHKSSIHDLTYEMPDDSSLEAENGLKNLVADLPSEQMEIDPLMDTMSEDSQNIEITEVPVDPSLDNEQLADAGITDTDLGITDGNFA